MLVRIENIRHIPDALHFLHQQIDPMIISEFLTGRVQMHVLRFMIGDEALQFILQLI